ncbi:MAG: hypothetical protein KA085_18205 [Phenylobacterium sp.]|uniref:hypothetical protein n=1 Tax=Phenylobacterium sp. TaxID=1871053 RepID=UPI001B51C728|nr:hypothetical protein [Phenylobacterium sp.]MBP7648477.1 hypothetical protein [Phenylobacterium sp.]MBP7818055.1 hypothetical protein [Phenylobacterium sp.]MBP9753793.1 hypothetical protein [Phenylobacterium sp.]
MTEHEAAGAPSERVVELPQPTQDQRDFLDGLCKQAGVYDPTVTVGGPSGIQNPTV